MPLIQHNVQEALRQAGIVKDPDAEDDSVSAHLDKEGLSLKETIGLLGDVALGADTSAVKLRAIETALKLRGVLKEQVAPPPSFNIVFSSPDDRPDSIGDIKINPILVPRPQPSVQ
jgi:hypothetical protein